MFVRLVLCADDDQHVSMIEENAYLHLWRFVLTVKSLGRVVVGKGAVIVVYFERRKL